MSGAVALSVAPTMTAGTFKRASAPIVITHSIPDGSNLSRAPFPAARPYDDVTPPNAMAFDQNVPPNTPATTPQPFPQPAPLLAIFQSRRDPGLLPTGPTLGAAMSLDAPRVEPSIRNAMYESRDQLIDGLRTRVRQSEAALSEFNRTRGEMSAAGRAQFETAYNDARARERTLERSIRAAARASAENWEAVRERLAADYSAYAQALAQIDAAAGIAPVR